MKMRRAMLNKTSQSNGAGRACGPALRRISALYGASNHGLGVDLRESVKWCDVGDIFTIVNIENGVTHVRSNGVIPSMLGGDHSIGYRDVHGVAPCMDGPVGFIHMDRHVDTQEMAMDEPMHTWPSFHAKNIANAPPKAARALAMMHAANCDAVNGITQTPEPYFVRGKPAEGASPEAAAAVRTKASRASKPSASARCWGSAPTAASPAAPTADGSRERGIFDATCPRDPAELDRRHREDELFTACQRRRRADRSA